MFVHGLFHTVQTTVSDLLFYFCVQKSIDFFSKVYHAFGEITQENKLLAGRGLEKRWLVYFRA
jgi:hypothetical protein